MRTTILMIPAVLLLTSGVALAQSGQGGYLGKNPGAHVESASQDPVAPPSVRGSGQGGYLGANPGANVETASQSPVKPPSVQGSGQGGYLGRASGAQR